MTRDKVSSTYPEQQVESKHQIFDTFNSSNQSHAECSTYSKGETESVHTKLPGEIPLFSTPSRNHLMFFFKGSGIKNHPHCA